MKNTNDAEPIKTEYVPGTGWVYLSKDGRYGGYETEADAILAGASARNGWRNFGMQVQSVQQDATTLTQAKKP